MARLIVMMFALLGAASLSSAQDFRGGITGRIVDTSGARIPGVTVTATNAATNVASTTTTNSDGDYAILFLNPGRCALSAELQGFKKMVRQNLEVRVGEKLGVDLTLEVGGVAEAVTVTAESPVLTTTSGSTGQTVGEKMISMIPLSDEPVGIVAGGAQGGNEFSLDGSPNMANRRRVAFVPPAGAVQETSASESRDQR